MIIIGLDGLNWKSAQEIYSDLFKEQTMKMIKCNVRAYTQGPLYEGGPTPGPTAVGLACLWSGEKIKNFHPNIFASKYGEDNAPYEYKTREGKPMDLIWDHFNNGKIYIKHQGPNWQDNYKELFKHYWGIKAKRCPSDELCIFSEVHKRDFDLFWIHTAIIKGGVMMPGCYEQGRVPTLMQYDEIRKNKILKKQVYMWSLKRYKEVIRYLLEIAPDELFIITSDHGTMTDINEPIEPQIDEIPIIINRSNINLDDINYQWDFKKIVLRLKGENQ